MKVGYLVQSESFAHINRNKPRSTVFQHGTYPTKICAFKNHKVVIHILFYFLTL